MAGCGGSAVPSSEDRTSPTATTVLQTVDPSPVSSTPSDASSPSPAALSDPVAVADPICKDEMIRDPGAPTVSVITGELVTIVYANPEGDLLCQYKPVWGDGAVVQGANEHLATRLTADVQIVPEDDQQWTGDTGTYRWGAVGPEVASVVIELGSPDSLLEATIAGGYFLAVIGPEVQCCLFTTVAHDAEGNELARQP